MRQGRKGQGDGEGKIGSQLLSRTLGLETTEELALARVRFPEVASPCGSAPGAPKSANGPLSEELPTSAATLLRQVFLGSE